MKRVKIITHSSCDLSDRLANEYDVKVIPDVINFENSVIYDDRAHIKIEDFYNNIDKYTKFPSSGHPSPEEFMSAYRAFSDYEDIICIVLSTGLSATLKTAELAGEFLAEEGFRPRIHVFDSQQVSYGMGFQVLEAAAMAQKGASAEEILAHLQEIRPRIGVYFAMKSLEFARLGGRVSFVRAAAADALAIKPLLTIKDGVAKDPILNRSFKGALSRIVSKYVSLVGDDKRLFIFHANDPAGAAKLEADIRAQVPDIQPQIEIVGPVVGLYTGIGCLGIAFLEKDSGV